MRQHFAQTYGPRTHERELQYSTTERTRLALAQELCAVFVLERRMFDFMVTPVFVVIRTEWQKEQSQGPEETAQLSVACFYRQARGC